MYPLAIQLADDLGTVFPDVLEGLEQLRKRQLPAQTYDQMNEVLYVIIVLLVLMENSYHQISYNQIVSAFVNFSCQVFLLYLSLIA